MGKQQPRDSGTYPRRGPRPSVDTAELEKFARMAEVWWDARGPMRPLHLMNPLRLQYILDRAREQLGGGERSPPLRDLAVLDIGCGAGLLSEPLARLGGMVTGLDPAGEALDVARWHANETGLEIAYRRGSLEDLVLEDRRFDLLLAMEVIEHVPDPHAFVHGLAELTRPGGLVILSTLSRTFKAWALAIIGAEYVLGWLPKGTHRWSRFIKPAELATRLRDAGLRPIDLSGVAFEPAFERFRLVRDPGVNYMIAAVRD
jgi:2-polyprenyl-6-hydroxyphenyl methylase / 3-demethylubiquinone-9 3-methyltransferase